MATSWTNNVCSQCQATPDPDSLNFEKGWQLRNGDFAKLCNRCASTYKRGSFCAHFHEKDKGWRECEFCRKLVHCGCIAGLNTFKLLDFGGVTCMRCWKNNFKEAQKQDLLSETKTENNGTQMESQNLPQVTSSELELGSEEFEPLFEKVLSAGDADHNAGHIILPKKGAEAYFPKITAPSGCSVIIQDTEGEEWAFQFKYWTSAGYRTYILEGMKEFMRLKQWQAGDIATFHRRVPGGKLVIGLRKKNSC